MKRNVEIEMFIEIFVEEIYLEYEDESDREEGQLILGGTDSSLIHCDICDHGPFATIDERNEHIEEHFKPIECPSCASVFVGDRAFQFHLTNRKCKNVQAKIKLFKCRLCNGKVFDSKEQLNKHLRTEHKCSVNEERVTCEQCNRVFGKMKYLRKHVRELHDKATPFNCNECGKQFNRKANLMEHKLIHQGIYLAQCKECNKSYRTVSALRLHERTHTGEKPYKCEICNQKSYAYNTDLKRHKRAVHGILGTPYPCTLCEKVFYEPKLLRNHTVRAHNKIEK